jgi:stage IV sporulation protein FB
MRDPFAWSIPFGRLFGITIRVHLLFPVVALGLLLRAAYQKDALPYQWIDFLIVLSFLFASVLLHEFGHCFAARYMQGDANEVLLWPLGGLANCEVPHTPRANFVVAVGGPLVNIFLCLAAALVLVFAIDSTLQPYLNPLYCLARSTDANFPNQVALSTWAGGKVGRDPYSAAVLVSHFFWVNWMLSLINLVLVAFPFDAGRILQSILWNYLGYRRATLAAVFCGFVVMFIVGIYSIVAQEVLALGLCIFIYVSCRHQWLVLEAGGEESLFGYDFSQGYTSLERDQPAPAAPPKPGWFERWRQKRAAKKLQREMERREAEERRMDELLEKISSQGMTALTDEERRFMKQYSDRYKNRHQ